MVSCAFNLGGSLSSLLMPVFLIGSSVVLRAAANAIPPQPAESISVHADEFRQVPGFIAVADRRIFTVMAFLETQDKKRA